MNNPVYVFTPEGFLLMDALTGQVKLATPKLSPLTLSGSRKVPHDPGLKRESNILSISRFDVEEFRTHYGCTVPEMPLTLDIRDLGYWSNQYREMVYTPGCNDYRAELKRAFQ